MKKRGFTLAETLITLVIIGFVAALTIPVLLNNKEKTETITELKEANAIFANAISMAKTDYGDTKTWDFELDGEPFAKKYITPYLKIDRVCGTTTAEATTVKCFDGAGDDWYDLNGEISNSGGYSRPWFYAFGLKNGMSAAVWRSVSWNEFAVIMVDINGRKGPTKIGRDVFAFTVSKNKGFSIGINGNNEDQLAYTRTDLLGTTVYGGCNKDAVNPGVYFKGSACGVVILKDGWEIKNDYPW